MTFAIPASISPTTAGIAVGVVTGVLGLLSVALFARASRRRRVMTIPPYATGVARITPLAPMAIDAEEPMAWQPRRPFVPSTQLSARALARIGIGPFGERIARSDDDEHDDYAAFEREDEDLDVAVDVAVDFEVEVEVDFVEGDDGSCRPAVSIAPVVLIGVPQESASVTPPSSNAMRAAPTSGFHAVAATSSGTMRAARIDDLQFDDAPTEVVETLFDEPPQPRTRSARPKIRQIQPAPPRFQRRS